MVHDFSGRPSGKFPGATERLKRYTVNSKELFQPQMPIQPFDTVVVLAPCGAISGKLV